MEEKRERRKRNKPTHYDKDIHIRVHEKYVEKIEQEAAKRGITKALMTRLIVEQYFDNQGITLSVNANGSTRIPTESVSGFTIEKQLEEASLQNAKDMLEWLKD